LLLNSLDFAVDDELQRGVGANVTADPFQINGSLVPLNASSNCRVEGYDSWAEAGRALLRVLQ
jgi:hypothetical protein